MSLIIDQTWVADWMAGIMTPEEFGYMKTWLVGTPSASAKLLTRFPPMALVRGKTPLEVPYPFSVGIVSGYRGQNEVGVQQSPKSEMVYVSADLLEVVGFWKSFNVVNVAEILRTRSLGR